MSRAAPNGSGVHTPIVADGYLLHWQLLEARYQGQTIVFGGLMKLYAIAILSFLTACADDPDGTDIKPGLDEIEYMRPTEKLNTLQSRLDVAQSTCKNGPGRSDPDGKFAMAEVDVAMADSIDSISPEQEQRIRASIGAEMGLAPSQVNGWKEIYRSRASQAAALLARREQEGDSAKLFACKSLLRLASEVNAAQESLRRAEAK